ncbi:MAG TPA: hypothetical protein VGP93_15480, partial [Polyangiaceae bacterium]|nr:hypothetical protein [Polyangiaceae bacterium]
GGDSWDKAPPASGTGLPAAWALPTQMSAYDSSLQSGRVTWGAVYGTFKNAHKNDTGSLTTGNHSYPVNAWSFSHVIGKFSDDVVGQRVADTEAIYATTMTASVGTVVTSGPRGPGTFVGPTVGTMPTIDYPNPGYDFVYRSWNITAESGLASFTLNVGSGKTLTRPTIVVHEFPGEVASVRVNGADLTANADYFASYDAPSQRLFITLASSLGSGTHTLAFGAQGTDLGSEGIGGGSGSAGSAATGGSGQVAGAGGIQSSGSGGPSPVGSGGSTSMATSPGGASAAAKAEPIAGGCGCRSAPQGSSSRGLAAAALLLSLFAFARRARGASRAAFP